MAHLAFNTLLSYAEDKLAEKAHSEVDEHLASSCAECQANLARLRVTLDALAADDTIAPPAQVARNAIAVFRKSLPLFCCDSRHARRLPRGCLDDFNGFLKSRNPVKHR